MPVPITWPQALAWRLDRQLLGTAPGADVPAIVWRLGGVQAQVASSAEQAVRVRQTGGGAAGEVEAALADGTLLRTWAMRGTLHLLTPDLGPAFLALIAASRPWARGSWQKAFGVSPAGIEQLRVLVRDALRGRTLTREELIAEVVAHEGSAHLGDALRSGWGTLLKPIAWQGDLCSGPMRGRNVTFRHPADACPAWTGLPPVEEAAPVAIAAYLGAYGPAPLAAFSRWLAGGWFGQQRLRAAAVAMEDRLVPLDVEGTPAVVLAEDLDGVRAARPTDELRLLPGFDQWVLGPGTDAASIIAPARRTAVSRTAGWIAPVVIRGGRVTGTWEVDGGTVAIDWFAEAGPAPREADLAAEVARWSMITGRPLTIRLALAG
ncbi:MAG: crosslink repair DNA glycosylase YcaQ family protein [Chloroflexota bacterium]